jgi:uncharacterized damage-inducible protein DinB
MPASGQAARVSASAGPLASVVQRLSSVNVYLVESAEKMPESDYAFRPTPDVRSFAELIGHVAGASYFFCSQAKEGPRPAVPNFEKMTAKSELVKGIKDALAYCDSVLASATETWLMETIKWGSPTNMGQGPRLGALMFNIAHNNEHYGNIVTYLRLKGHVPPSTERAQAAPR